MAISLSNAHFSPQDSTGYFVYALRRDDDDMLHFTKVSTASTTESFDPFRLDGTQVEEFGDYNDYVEETTEQKALANNLQDKYQQIRFDRRNLNYFLDTDGYLVLQVNGTHSYSGPV
tara:strand:- start:415 stop:765 length:351 start_codon:yes stop_codon:yes gene_type:complete